MLCKLAWGNVRRAGKDYLVYLLTLTLGVTVFYAFNTVSLQVDIAGIKEEGLSDLLGSALSNLTFFLAGVMAFLMVYANNFIMKRRKREFGLYQVLGMGRSKVALIMVLECVIVSGAALVVGTVLGVALSWFMTFFTASIFKTQIADFHFFFSLPAFDMTFSCLALIFLLTLILDLCVVRRAKIIDLMGAGRRNESVKTRNPWFAAALFALGAMLVGVAYARLLRDGLPVSGEAAEFKAFGITTAMVTGGTFMLFFGLSGLLIKLAQALRGVYWRGLNMYTVRQLAAKINTVSFSMGVIAMVLFLAITAVTCGMSIAAVMNENVERFNPVDASQTVVYNSEQTMQWIRMFEPDRADDLAMPTEPIDVYSRWHGTAMENGKPTGTEVDISDVAGEHVQLDQYLTMSQGSTEPAVSLGGICDALGRGMPKGMENSDADSNGLYAMRESQYNAYRKLIGAEPIDLGSSGYVITSEMGDGIVDVYDAFMAAGESIELGGRTLEPAAAAVDRDASAVADSAMGSNSGTVIVPDELIEKAGFIPYTSTLLVNYKHGMRTEDADAAISHTMLHEILVDGKGVGEWGASITRTEMYEQAASMNGLISYLAIYIGFVLVVACASILSIQQLSNVADGGRSQRVLAEIGCETAQIRRSVLAQQAVFFVFPLAVGVAHAAVALRVIIDLVQLFGNMSIGGTVGLTCAVFLAAYGGYFLVTYAMSSGMVSSAIATRYTE